MNTAKRVFVTGASSGLGYTLISRLLELGFTVCGVSRNVDPLMELSRDYPDQLTYYSADITRYQDVEEVTRKARTELGGIDILINNAGITGAGIQDTRTMVDRVIDTNLKGAIYVTMELVTGMIEAGGGDIINIASIMGNDISPEGKKSVYSASKHGLVAYSESISRLYRSQGIRVVVLSPGGIQTPLWNEHNPSPHDLDELIRPDEVVDLILYIIQSPRRLLFKNVLFVPMVEKW